LDLDDAQSTSVLGPRDSGRPDSNSPSERPDAGLESPDAAGPSLDGGHDDVPCPTGQTSCDGVCRTLGTDAANCGGCGIACSIGESCVIGLCRGSSSIWPTPGGDIHHSGYNANESGAPPLTATWTAALGKYGGLSPAVSDGNAIYISQNPSQNPSLWAVSPADGHVQWSHSFGDIFGAGQVTVNSGYVYVAQCNNNPGTAMNAFVGATGKLEWSHPFDAQWENFWAPLVVGGRVYFDGGEYGGLYSLDQSTGAKEFFANEDQWDEWSPMFLDGHIYTFTNGHLRMFDPAGGALLASATVAWNWAGYSMNSSAVSDGTRIFVIAPPNLIAFAPSLSAPLWTVNGEYASQPAVANGVLYAISGGQLRAHDASSGTVLWTFPADSALAYPPVVAGHHVYVASRDNVYAVDVSTQQQAWTGTPGGWLSIANGQLYVARTDGTLAAWTMTR
jgi:outer membrane protein assembly factor BamB